MKVICHIFGHVFSQRHLKKDEARALQNWRSDTQLSQSLSSISREDSYPTNLPYSHQLLLVFEGTTKTSFRQMWRAFARGHLPKLSWSKVLDVTDARESFSKRALSAPMLLPCPRRLAVFSFLLITPHSFLNSKANFYHQVLQMKFEVKGLCKYFGL